MQTTFKQKQEEERERAFSCLSKRRIWVESMYCTQKLSLAKHLGKATGYFWNICYCTVPLPPRLIAEKRISFHLAPVLPFKIVPTCAWKSSMLVGRVPIIFCWKLSRIYRQHVRESVPWVKERRGGREGDYYYNRGRNWSATTAAEVVSATVDLCKVKSLVDNNCIFSLWKKKSELAQVINFFFAFDK